MLDDKNIPAYEFNTSIAETVDKICEPLFQTFGITHFGYIKIFPNKKMFRVANNSAWSKKYFESTLYNDLNFYGMDKIPINSSQSFVFFAEPETKHCKLLCHDFNIWNLFTIYERFKDYGNFWFFGASRENTKILDFYLNKSNLIKSFICFFKSKMDFIINNISEDALIHLAVDPMAGVFPSQKNIDNFLLETEIHKYYLINNDKKDVYLSKREFECVVGVARGKSINEVAKTLDLSSRTVESHIVNSKIKLGAYSKDHLIDIINNSLLL